MKKKFYFVRHGHVANPDHILYGRLADFSLSSKGREQAEQAAVFLKNKDIDVIYTSPMLRAKQTAEAIHEFHSTHPIATSDNLNEVLTPYQGMKAGTLKHLNEDYYTGTEKPYEQPGDIVKRVQDFIGEVRRKENLCEVVAVTHGDIIVFLVLSVKGLGVVPENKMRLTSAGLQDCYPATASITTLTYFTKLEDEMPVVEYFSPAR